MEAFGALLYANSAMVVEIPVVLLIRTIDADILFQGLVCTFRLSVGLRMVSRSEVEFHVKSFSKSARELGDKLGATVRGDVVRYTMLGENMNDDNWGKFFRINGVVCKDKDGLLAQSITTRIAVNLLESGNCSMKFIEMESHGQFWNRQGFKQTVQDLT